MKNTGTLEVTTPTESEIARPASSMHRAASSLTRSPSPSSSAVVRAQVGLWWSARSISVSAGPGGSSRAGPTAGTWECAASYREISAPDRSVHTESFDDFPGESVVTTVLVEDRTDDAESDGAVSIAGDRDAVIKSGWSTAPPRATTSSPSSWRRTDEAPSCSRLITPRRRRCASPSSRATGRGRQRIAGASGVHGRGLDHGAARRDQPAKAAALRQRADRARPGPPAHTAGMVSRPARMASRSSPGSRASSLASSISMRASRNSTSAHDRITPTLICSPRSTRGTMRTMA